MARDVTLTQFDLLGVDFDLRANTLTMRYQARDDAGDVRVNGTLVAMRAPEDGGDPPPGVYYLSPTEAGALTALRRMLRRQAARIMDDPSLEEQP